MSFTDEWKHTVDKTLERHASILEGDGNGDLGLVRKTDGVTSKLDTLQKRLDLGVKIAVAVLTIVLAQLVTTLLKQSYGPAPQQNVSQSVTTSDDTKPPATFYAVPDLAAKMGLSEREIQDRASKGEIPGAFKDGKAWRFKRDAVDAALAAKAASAASAER